MTDGQQNLGGINLSLVAKCVRMHQVCWGESKIIAVKSAVLCEVFSSRTSKKQESRTLKLHRLYVSSSLKFGMSSRCSVAISPWVGSLNTALSPLLSSSSPLHLCLLGTRGSGSCWVAFPAVPGWKEPSFQDIHTHTAAAETRQHWGVPGAFDAPLCLLHTGVAAKGHSSSPHHWAFRS